ncbi:ankyrin-2 [Aspergillus tubingensis]|nr:ankyrin-2 [Aspergillus tubingensis]
MDTMTIAEPASETAISAEAVQPSLSYSGAQEKSEVSGVDSTATPTEAELEGLRPNLITAIEEPDLSRFRELLTHKGAIEIDLDYRFPDESEDNTGLSLLILASALGKEPIVDYLLDEGRINVELGASYPVGWTALHMAAWGGHERVIKKLLTKVADVDSTNDYRETALHCACQYGRLEAVKTLIDKKADVNRKNRLEETPLHYACDNGHLKVAITLIEKGANVHSKSGRGYTPLHYACRSGHKEVAEMLIKEKAEIDAESATGHTPLHHACLNDQLETAKMLIDKGADVNHPTENKYTPLHNACWDGYLDVVQMLIENKADVHYTDEDGWNALHFASMLDDDSVLRHLLSLTGEIKLDRNCRSTTGQTPLMVAINSEYEICANVLLDGGGVDVSLKTERGDTALAFFPDNLIEGKICLSSPYELEQLEPVFVEWLANGIICGDWGNKVMCWAVVNGSVKVMKKCGEKFPDAKGSPDGQTTWLHLASKYGRQVLIKELIWNYNIDVTATIAQKMTALHLAAQGGHIMTVQNLLHYFNEKYPGNKAADIKAGTPPSQKKKTSHSMNLVDLILSKNEKDDNAITLARKSNHRAICDILWKELSDQISNNELPSDNSASVKEHLVEIAAQYGTPGKEEVVKTILQQSKTIKEDQKHWTTLHWVIDEPCVAPT